MTALHKFGILSTSFTWNAFPTVLKVIPHMLSTCWLLFLHSVVQLIPLWRPGHLMQHSITLLLGQIALTKPAEVTGSYFPFAVLMTGSFIIALDGFSTALEETYKVLEMFCIDWPSCLKVKMDCCLSLIIWAVLAIIWTLSFTKWGCHNTTDWFKHALRKEIP